jgi:hypothetical protein
MVTEVLRCAPHACTCPTCRQHPRSAVAADHRLINRLLAAADERLRRLFAGFLARQLGSGGVSQLQRISGLDRKTIAKGLRELRQQDEPLTGRIRRPGGGRKPVEQSNPGS